MGEGSPQFRKEKDVLPVLWSEGALGEVSFGKAVSGLELLGWQESPLAWGKLHHGRWKERLGVKSDLFWVWQVEGIWRQDGCSDVFGSFLELSDPGTRGSSIRRYKWKGEVTVGGTQWGSCKNPSQPESIESFLFGVLLLPSWNLFLNSSFHCDLGSKGVAVNLLFWQVPAMPLYSLPSLLAFLAFFSPQPRLLPCEVSTASLIYRWANRPTEVKWLHGS